MSVYLREIPSYTETLIGVAMQRKNVMSNSEKDRLAEEVVELWVSFQMALSNKRKYPAAEFTSFVAGARRYVEAIPTSRATSLPVCNS